MGQRDEIVSERRDRSLGTDEDRDTREGAKLGEMRSGRREIQGWPVEVALKCDVVSSRRALLIVTRGKDNKRVPLTSKHRERAAKRGG